MKRLVEACGAAMAAQPARRREADDNSKRVGGLFWRLNAGQVSAPVQAQLVALARALDAGDLATASQIQVRIGYPSVQDSLPRLLHLVCRPHGGACRIWVALQLVLGSRWVLTFICVHTSVIFVLGKEQC